MFPGISRRAPCCWSNLRVRKRFRTICKGEPKQNQWFNAVGPLHLQRLSLQLAGQSAVGLFTSVSTLRAASARLQRPHRTEALGIVNRFHTSGPQSPFAPRVPASTGSLRPQCPQRLSCDPLPQASKRDRYALLPAAFVRPPAGSARPAYVARRPVMSRRPASLSVILRSHHEALRCALSRWCLS